VSQGVNDEPETKGSHQANWAHDIEENLVVTIAMSLCDSLARAHLSLKLLANGEIYSIGNSFEILVADEIVTPEFGERRDSWNKADLRSVFHSTELRRYRECLAHFALRRVTGA
jgi:hypothetical protein